MPKVLGSKGKGAAVSHGYLLTGFYSMDCAFNPYGQELGIPYGTLWELYGAPATAKSTTAYSLASMLAAHLDTGWILLDAEDAFTPDYVSTIGENHGMSENTYIVLAKGKYHEERLKDIFTQMHDEVVGVGIIDSLGMLASRAEVDGELGEANMGKRAFLINQWVRQFFMQKNLDFGYLPPYATVFMINHQQPAFSGYGTVRPGGTGKDYGAGVRVHLKREEEFADGSLLITGTIKKLRWSGGGMDNTFQFVSKVGYGMHKGLSAIMDLKKMKVLKFYKGVMSAGDVKMPHKFSYYLKTGDEADFQPFYDLLVEHKADRPSEEVEEEL